MDLYKVSYIKELLERHGFHFSKSMGQNGNRGAHGAAVSAGGKGRLGGAGQKTPASFGGDAFRAFKQHGGNGGYIKNRYWGAGGGAF